MRLPVLAGLAALLAALGAIAAVSAQSALGPQPAPPSLRPLPDLARWEPVAWRRSKAVGKPWRGRLIRAVKLPAEGAHWFTWDLPLDRRPNRIWRRHGHDRLLRTLLRVLAEYRAEHPFAPRVGVADLSRPKGGPFGRRYGGLGHASHQNGLDVDLLYPRRDRRERKNSRTRQIDAFLAQDLVNRLVRAGAEKVFVGPRTGLRGRRGVVVPLPHHDDHLHVRIRARRGSR